MITMHNSGGRLGNFMFQAAACAALAWRNNVGFGIPDSPTYSRYFPKLPKIPESYRVSNFYTEPSAGYTPIPFEDGMCLVGYYQSWKYYDDYLQQIRDLFDFPTFFFKDQCSIHIRRGDYTELLDKHCMPGKDYLAPAIKYMNERGFYRFIVYGDDKKWNEENINAENYGDFEFEYSKEEDPYLDMCSMASCEANIICASTFSIWAAELNRNPDKIVVTPHEDNYYGPTHKSQDVKDLLRPEWVKIRY